MQVLFAENLVDRQRIRSQADGLDWLQAQAELFTPEATQVFTGIEPETVRALARDLATTPRAAIYGRLGTCVGEFGTLTSYLIDAVNLACGNLDRVGGSVFNSFGMPGQKWGMKVMGAVMRRTYRRKRSRIGGFRYVIGSEPAAMMAKEITTPGDRQIRALFVSAGNPVLSVPNGGELERAIPTLELSVALDFYLTETTSQCEYVLPVTTMYERDDFAVTFQAFQATPFRQATEAVVDPVGQSRTEWQIIDELARRMARRTPMFAALGMIRRLVAGRGGVLDPRPLIDFVIRLSQGGDRFGFGRGGLTFRRLAQDHPHGVVVAPHIQTGMLRDVVAYRGGRARLVHDDIAAEIAALWRRTQPAGYPLRMIGMREPRSENSWMHNSPMLMRGNRIHRAVMHVDDAAGLGIADGDAVRVSSRHGQIEIPVSLTAGIVSGTIAIPHGWGHKGTGGWQLANRAGGANANALTSSEPEDVESLSGMARLTGVPVRVDRMCVDSASMAEKFE